jgi:hypothetical protein
MVSTCANPGCFASFHRLQEGRLFVFDPRDRKPPQSERDARLQFYWLCEKCAERLTLAIDPADHVLCIARPEGQPEVAMERGA